MLRVTRDGDGTGYYGVNETRRDGKKTPFFFIMGYDKNQHISLLRCPPGRVHS